MQFYLHRLSPMKRTPTDLLKLSVYNNFIDFFSTALGPTQQQYGYKYVCQDASFPAFNSILETQNEEAVFDQAIPDIIKTYQSHERPCCWWVIEGLSPPSLPQTLLAYGFKKENAFTGMYHDLSAPIKIPHALEHIQVKQLDNKNDFYKLNHVIQKAFGMDPKSAALYQATFERLFDDERFNHYYIETNNTIVASGTIFFKNGVSGFYNLAVLPEFRNHGYGLAMQWQRLKISQMLGAKLCILQASEMAYKIDLDVGFVPIMQFTPYVLIP